MISRSSTHPPIADLISNAESREDSPMKKTSPLPLAPLVVAAALLVSTSIAPGASADDKNTTKKTAKAGLKTGGNAARDGAKTAGHTVKAFFTGGPQAAKKAAKEGAAETKKNAKANAKETKKAAKGN